jgi:hypothetical protein
MVELALSSYPGLYALGPPQPGSAFGVYRPALLDQAVLEHLVHHLDRTTEVIPPSDAHGAGGEVTPQAESLTISVRPPWTAGELVVASLGEIVHARSGDKGGDANLGVWVGNRHSPRNPRPGDLPLRTPQPRRGQLRPPRIARDRRHLDTAAGRTGEGTRRMAARTQHQGAAIPSENLALPMNRPSAISAVRGGAAAGTAARCRRRGRRARSERRRLEEVPATTLGHGRCAWDRSGRSGRKGSLRGGAASWNVAQIG